MDYDDFIPFSKRPEWSDVKPLKQDDGANPVCSIAYSPEFQEVMGYFRAILHSDERSERALKLTQEVIFLSPANYTAWYFRRLCLYALKKDLNEELKFVSDLADENPKNYQIWYHRHALVEKLNEPGTELEFTSAMIKEDNKNYHAWAHRQWIVQTFNLWEKELKFVNSMIDDDFRNNSGWNQRYFLLTHANSRTPTKQEREAEIEFAMTYIKKAPNNESPWVYLKGLFTNTITKEELNSLIALLENFKEKYVTCAHAVSFLAELYEQTNTKESLNKSKQYFTQLETSMDSIHAKFWAYRFAQVDEKLQQLK